MYEVTVRTRFSAAHKLKGYDGPCAQLHGHNWVVQVFIRGDELDNIGMLVDFRDVKDAIAATLENLDHADLNALPEFGDSNPTSENIARHVFEKLSAQFNSSKLKIHRVTIQESPETGVTYSASTSSSASK